MSSTAPSDVGSSGLRTDRSQVIVIGHSMMFYWWPVWAFGFFAAAWTFVEGNRAALVPADTTITKIGEDKYEITFSKKVTASITEAVARSSDPNLTGRAFRPRVSEYTFLGAAFVIILLLVILITNIPLRGMVAMLTVAALVIVLLAVMYLGVLDNIVQAFLGSMNVYMNLSAYLVIASVLFAMWLFTVMLFDQSMYIIFTPGQMRVRLEIGDSETSFDTIGMSIEKKRDDPFRHWVLGFAWWPGLGTGDLVVKTSGANAREFHLPNVLRIDSKLAKIQEMTRDRPMVKG